MEQRLPRIAICGHGRSGKDTAAHYLASITPLRLGKTTSEIIAPYAAAKLGQPVAVAFADRHNHRVFWFEVGNELRATDPAFLVRECLKDGEIVVGMRNRSEVLTVGQERLVDLIVWIERDVPTDPTQEYGPELCDVVIPNNGTLEELHRRLGALARWANLLKPSGG